MAEALFAATWPICNGGTCMVGGAHFDCILLWLQQLRWIKIQNLDTLRGLDSWHCDINEARYVFSRTMHHCHRNCQTLRFMARDCIGQNNWKLGNTSIFFPFLFLFIQVSLEISTMPTPSKATKRTSPFSPVNIPRDPFFKSWDLFHTSITLQPCVRCRTVALGQHMLLEQSFSNDASKANNSPGNASSSRLFDNCTGTFRKKICIATCCKASGKTLSKDERYC